MDSVRTIEHLPCRSCSHGADVRHWLTQTDGIVDERQRSPGLASADRLLPNQIGGDRAASRLMRPASP
jgi:hypothetical protein